MAKIAQVDVGEPRLAQRLLEVVVDAVVVVHLTHLVAEDDAVVDPQLPGEQALLMLGRPMGLELDEDVLIEQDGADAASVFGCFTTMPRPFSQWAE